MIRKLVIGTANFGLRYGIANDKKLSGAEVFAVLDRAHEYGVLRVDTARAYGSSEAVLGEYFSERGKVFEVIGKLPKKEYSCARDVEEEVFGSLRNMNISHMDFLLFHSYETYESYGKTIVPVLQGLCRDKVIGRFGVSVYHPSEAETVAREAVAPMTIEFPLNLFDRRFLKNGMMKRLKGEGHLLFARSVFLQGLFFLKVNALAGNFERVREKIGMIGTIAGEYGMRPECLALLFSGYHEWLDGVVIGVDGVEHLDGNVHCFSEGNRDIFNRMEGVLPDLEVYDEDILLPYRWKT